MAYSVVRPAPAVEPIPFHLRRPGSEAVSPPGHLGLLVEVAVEQKAVVALTWHLDEDERGASREPDDLELHAFERVRLAPAHHVGNRGLHVAVLGPVRIELRRLVRDADVLDELGHDGIVPERFDVGSDSVGIHAYLMPIERTSGRRPRNRCRPAGAGGGRRER